MKINHNLSCQSVINKNILEILTGMGETQRKAIQTPIETGATAKTAQSWHLQRYVMKSARYHANHINTGRCPGLQLELGHVSFNDPEQCISIQ